MNIKDFCKEANKSPIFKTKWKLKVTSKLLKNANYIKKSYMISDLAGLDKILEQKKKDKEFKEKYGELVSILQKYDFILNVVINSYSVKKLLLLTLSDKFQKEIRKLKKKYKIPEEGFEIESQEFKNWLQPSKQQSFYQDIDDLFRRHRLRFFTGLGFGYVLFRSFLKIVFMNFRISLPCCPFDDLASEYREPIFTSSSFENFLREYRYPYLPLSSDYPYAIIIPRPVSKEELVSYINKNWKNIKEEIKECFKPTSKSRKFQRDFLIFALYRHKATIKGIREVLKYKNLYMDLSGEEIKKIIKRQKERIEKLEKGT